MSKRLYLGRLPSDTRPEDVQKFFDGYGKIIDCRVMSGFGFVEFENNRDAEEVVNNFNGKAFLGQNIIVEFAKETRRRDNYEDRGGGGRPPPRSRRPAGFRVIVSGLSRDTSWQDLKDFAREAGSVSFADVDRDAPNQGVIEYVSQSDSENAVRILDGRDLRGAPVRVTADDRPAGGRDRDRGDRGGGDHYRRDRSRSPRRDYDRRDHRDRDDRRDYRDDRRDDRYRGDDKRDHRDDRREDRRRSPRRDEEREPEKSTQ